MGSGFVIDAARAAEFKKHLPPENGKVIRPIVNARDLTQSRRGVYAIDLLGLDLAEVRSQLPQIYQWLHDSVKPERDQSKRESYRRLWWLFGEPRKSFRPALFGLSRYIVTPMTAKHRTFLFETSDTLADQGLVVIASDDVYLLGVLSSRVHVCWALAQGGRLGMGNDPRYNNTRCFETFPFPDADESQKARVRLIAESLHEHRKRVLDEHNELMLTQLYNVMAALNSGATLTAKERLIHDKGLVGVLRELHAELDSVVAEAYGWPGALSDEELLMRLVELNAKRVAEEKVGIIRWLRPSYQNPEGNATNQSEFAVKTIQAATSKSGTKISLPADLPGRFAAVRHSLSLGAATPAEVAKRFKGARKTTVDEICSTLLALGQIRDAGHGRFQV